MMDMEDSTMKVDFMFVIVLAPAKQKAKLNLSKSKKGSHTIYSGISLNGHSK